MVIRMDLGERGYDIAVERGALRNIGELLQLNRKVLVVTDDGVPAEYAETVAAAAKEGFIETVPQGEKSKNFENYRKILARLVRENFTRSDCIAAVGGGVVGDLAGFAAACFMRGIDFYNIPTTVLSQIDSSIGGKTAIDFEGYKNIVGAFYQPKKVVIDSDVLKTLPKRQIVNGLAEAVKMSLTSDASLFELFEKEEPLSKLDEIIVRSLIIKKNVVEQDEKEAGLRKVLNFGHTLGHGIESEQEGRLLHGECVALGMVPMCGDAVRGRLLAVMKKLGLLRTVSVRKDKVMEAVLHDKKFRGDKISLIRVEKAGSFLTEEADAAALSAYLDHSEVIR